MQINKGTKSVLGYTACHGRAPAVSAGKLFALCRAEFGSHLDRLTSN